MRRGWYFCNWPSKGLFDMPILTAIKFMVAVAAICISSQSGATAFYIDPTTITSISVNGGVDTVNPGTTCIQVSSPVSAACTSGFVAILNNNKQLLSAAFLGKATASKILFYYDDATGSNHCPGMVFTPCSVISIMLK